MRLINKLLWTTEYISYLLKNKKKVIALTILLFSIYMGLLVGFLIRLGEKLSIIFYWIGLIIGLTTYLVVLYKGCKLHYDLSKKIKNKEDKVWKI